MAVTVVIFRNEATPALQGVSVSCFGQGTLIGTHKTPMLMDITTPSFSFLLMVDAQMMNHGNSARAMSANPE